MLFVSLTPHCLLHLHPAYSTNEGDANRESQEQRSRDDKREAAVRYARSVLPKLYENGQWLDSQDTLPSQGTSPSEVAPDTPINSDKEDLEGPFLDHHHQYRIRHVALILLMSMFQWDHLLPSEKNSLVGFIRPYLERLAERGQCQVLCMSCHFAKTIAERDSVTGRGLVPQPRGSVQIAHLIGRVREKLQRSQEQGGICCGTSYKPGREPECVHESAMPGWLQLYVDAWEDEKLKSYYDCDGAYQTAIEFFLVIMTHWDHINAWKKNQGVPSIRDKAKRVAEIKLCQLLCPYCHGVKTLLNRDMVSWSYLAYAVTPFYDGESTPESAVELPLGWSRKRPVLTDVGVQAKRPASQGRDVHRGGSRFKGETNPSPKGAEGRELSSEHALMG
jgi:glutaredoxin